MRRVEIPKPDGGTRPLGVAALEDKIVQKAVVDVILTPIYEVEFLGFSYGFRPGQGAHDALDALAFGIERRKVSWIVDADRPSPRTRRFAWPRCRRRRSTPAIKPPVALLNRRQRGVGKPEVSSQSLVHYQNAESAVASRGVASTGHSRLQENNEEQKGAPDDKRIPTVTGVKRRDRLPSANRRSS